MIGISLPLFIHITLHREKFNIYLKKYNLLKILDCPIVDRIKNLMILSHPLLGTFASRI